MWKLKPFNTLTNKELYTILKLRSEIFVVEQTCIYQDIDGLDEASMHLYFIDKQNIAVYARILTPDVSYKGYTSIGRVLVNKTHRKLGLGHQLMQKAIVYLKENYSTYPIKIGAQLYLKKFYESHGFVQIGADYIEDGIPHIHMVLEF
jgi:ElaA protein